MRIASLPPIRPGLTLSIRILLLWHVLITGSTLVDIQIWFNYGCLFCFLLQNLYCRVDLVRLGLVNNFRTIFKNKIEVILR